MTPPTCRFCKKTEWNHVCKGAATPKVKAGFKKAAKPAIRSKPIAEKAEAAK